MTHSLPWSSPHHSSIFKRTAVCWFLCSASILSWSYIIFSLVSLCKKGAIPVGWLHCHLIAYNKTKAFVSHSWSQLRKAEHWIWLWVNRLQHFSSLALKLIWMLLWLQSHEMMISSGQRNAVTLSQEKWYRRGVGWPVLLLDSLFGRGYFKKPTREKAGLVIKAQDWDSGDLGAISSSIY